MRARVRFAKAGKLRFISAIDLGRVWERALRKADLPIAYSEGFSPHPKVSFGDALPLGYASIAEFAELTFGGPVDLADMAARLNTAFPEGLEVLDAIETVDGDRRLGKLLQASLWGIDYPTDEGLQDAVDALPPDGPLEVQRERKGEMVTTDLRPPLVGIAAVGAQVRAVVRHPGFIPVATEGAQRSRATEGGVAVRAEDIHAALGIPHRPHLISRLAQGHAATDPTGVADALRDTTVALVPDGNPSARAAGAPAPTTASQEDAR